jgi:hypothetical protein
MATKLRVQVLTVEVRKVLDDSSDPVRTFWPVPPLKTSGPESHEMLVYIEDEVRGGNYTVVGSREEEETVNDCPGEPEGT